MLKCPQCELSLAEHDLKASFACRNCGAKLKSNRPVLWVTVEISAAFGGIPLIGWVVGSNAWYLAGAIGYWLVLYMIYRAALSVTRDNRDQRGRSE
jgi:hypothetical protein